MNFYKMLLVNQYTGVVNNIDKCYHVYNGENTEASKYELGSGDNKLTIKRVESEKDLDIHDDKLNFHENHKERKHCQ